MFHYFNTRQVIKKISLALIFSFLFNGAYTQEISADKLLECLPANKSIGGLNRSAPTADPGSVTVKYEKVKDDNPSIEITISELPPALQQLRASGVGEVIMPEGEGDDGNMHKHVTIKGGYKVEESVSKNKDGDCELVFYIGKKIQVKLRGVETTNVKLLYTLIEGMALGKLEKL